MRDKTKHILWTEEETVQLVSMLKERMPIKDIARKLKRKEKAIRKKCEWLGMSSSTTYGQKKRIIKLARSCRSRGPERSKKRN
jgi:hypothetical protein